MTETNLPTPIRKNGEANDFPTQGFSFTGEVRLVKSSEKYVEVYLLPEDGVYASRFSVGVSTNKGQQALGFKQGQLVRVALSEPRVATSKAGKPYLSQFPLVWEVLAE